MSMLQNPASKYRPFVPVRLTDRTWPDATITKPFDPMRLPSQLAELLGWADE